MIERCALSGSDLKIKFRTILLTSILRVKNKGFMLQYYFKGQVV